jgi:putative FmdB family regulatory protein
MPLYEFRCDTCGVFEQWRTLAETGEPMHCPTCQAVAKRFFSPPLVNLSSGSLRRPSQETQEPRLVKRATESKPTTPRQSRCGRPWMIGH